MALSKLAMGMVTTIVVMYVGLFMIDTTSGFLDVCDFNDYVYTTQTNTTEFFVNETTVSYVNVTLPSIEDMGCTVDAHSTVVFNFTNTNDTSATGNFSILVSHNGAELGNVTALIDSFPQGIFENVVLVEGVNNFTFVAELIQGDPSLENLHHNQTVVYYASSKTSNNFGLISDALGDNTATIYDVLILVIVIVALAVAIHTLKGMSGGGVPSTVSSV